MILELGTYGLVSLPIILPRLDDNWIDKSFNDLMRLQLVIIGLVNPSMTLTRTSDNWTDLPMNLIRLQLVTDEEQTRTHSKILELVSILGWAYEDRVNA